MLHVTLLEVAEAMALLPPCLLEGLLSVSLPKLNQEFDQEKNQVINETGFSQ